MGRYLSLLKLQLRTSLLLAAQYRWDFVLDGATSMAGLWLTFFRDNCSSFVGLFILLPATMIINWRLGGLLVVLGSALWLQLGGLSTAMGAFLAGVLLSESTFRHQLEADVEPFRDEPSPRAAEPSFDADSVFAKLKPLRRGAGDEE